jgi:hypothetical protein
VATRKHVRDDLQASALPCSIGQGAFNLPGQPGHVVSSHAPPTKYRARAPFLWDPTTWPGQDINRAYDDQVCAYIVKPTDPDQYFSAMRSIKELWFHVVALPRAETASNSH